MLLLRYPSGAQRKNSHGSLLWESIEKIKNLNHACFQPLAFSYKLSSNPHRLTSPFQAHILVGTNMKRSNDTSSTDDRQKRPRVPDAIACGSVNQSKGFENDVGGSSGQVLDFSTATYVTSQRGGRLLLSHWKNNQQQDSLEMCGVSTLVRTSSSRYLKSFYKVP